MSQIQPVSPPAIPDEKKLPRSGGIRKRLLNIGVILLLVVVIIAAWLFLNNLKNNTDPTVAGRPLSNPHTHLHTVAAGGQPGILYLGTHYGLFTSTDGGKTWPQQRGSLNNLMITNIAISPLQSHVLAVIGRPATSNGGQTGIYFSTDGGTNWNIGNTPDGLTPNAYLFTIQAGTGNSGHFYAFYIFAGWFETRDMGATWHAITGGALSNMETPSLLTDPTNPDHLLLGGDQGLYETTDDGKQWNRITEVNGNVQNIVASSTTPRRIFCTTDQGIYRWQEGSKQIQLLSHLPMQNLPSRLLVNSGGNILYALSGQDVWYTGDGGNSWEKRGSLDRNDMTAFLLDPLDSSHLYVGFFLPARVIESKDGGRSWHTLTE